MKKLKSDNEFMNKKRKRPSEVRQWFCTWPQCKLTKDDALKLLQDKMGSNIYEYLICEEKHEDGSPHLHAYINLLKKRKFREDLFDIGEYHGHYEPCNSPKDVQKYCKKDGNYICNFALVEKSKKEKIAERNKFIISNDINKLVDEGEISVFCVPTIQKAKNILELNYVPPRIIKRRCYWIYGKPRIGKSFLVREAFDIYEKPLNKWWDGYKKQQVVLIDDIDDVAKFLGHYMKIWADDYRFVGEIKGGSIYPSYNCLIVTSNYKPRDIWGEDMILVEAISARFTLIEMEERSQQKEIQEIIKKELNN